MAADLCEEESRGSSANLAVRTGSSQMLLFNYMHDAIIVCFSF